MELEKNISDEQSASETLPSVRQAFEIGLKSYEWSLQRVDVRDRMISAFAALAAAATLGVSALLIKDLELDLNQWFYSATIAFALFLILALASMFDGNISLIDPKQFGKKYLRMDSDEFYLIQLRRVATSFHHNRRVVARKAEYLIWMSIIFAYEIVSIILWVYLQ